MAENILFSDSVSWFRIISNSTIMMASLSHFLAHRKLCFNIRILIGRHLWACVIGWSSNPAFWFLQRFETAVYNNLMPLLAFQRSFSEQCIYPRGRSCIRTWYTQCFNCLIKMVSNLSSKFDIIIAVMGVKAWIFRSSFRYFSRSIYFISCRFLYRLSFLYRFKHLKL